MISGKKSGFKMWIQSAPSILELPGNTAFPPKKNLGCLLACLMPLPARIGQLTSTVPLALAVCMSGRPAEPGWTASKKGVWAAQLPAPLPSPSVPLHSRDQTPVNSTPSDTDTAACAWPACRARGHGGLASEDGIESSWRNLEFTRDSRV